MAPNTHCSRLLALCSHLQASPAHHISAVPRIEAAATAATDTAKPLAGKRALVTGGSRGVGESCAVRLASLGCDVAINYARTADRAQAVVETCEALGVKALAVQADISTDEECKALVAKAVAGLGGLDILVNNAGFTRYLALDQLDDVTEEMWDSLMATNVKGQFNVARAAFP